MFPSRFGGTDTAAVHIDSTGAIPAYLNDISKSRRLSLLQNWRKALRKVQAGTSDAKILFIGDSTFAGVGSGTTPEVVGSAANRLVSLLNSQGRYAAALGLAIPPSHTDTDNRWTLGSGWSHSGLGFALDTCYQAAGAGSGNLVFAPAGGYSYDTFDVYYMSYPGAGGAGTITATGGSAVPFDSNTTQAIRKVTCTAGSAGTSNSVSIAVTNSGTLWILGVEPSLSSTKKVRAGVAGVGSSTSGGWNNSFLGQSSTMCIQAYAPDLSFINLGINDNTNTVSASTLISNITPLVTAAQASGDVILHTMFPSSSVGLEPQYVAAIRAFAAANNLPLLDFYSSFGGVQPAALAFDTLHPNGLGYWDNAALLLDAVSV